MFNKENGNFKYNDLLFINREPQNVVISLRYPTMDNTYNYNYICNHSNNIDNMVQYFAQENTSSPSFIYFNDRLFNTLYNTNNDVFNIYLKNLKTSESKLQMLKYVFCNLYDQDKFNTKITYNIDILPCVVYDLDENILNELIDGLSNDDYITLYVNLFNTYNDKYVNSNIERILFTHRPLINFFCDKVLNAIETINDTFIDRMMFYKSDVDTFFTSSIKYNNGVVIPMYLYLYLSGKKIPIEKYNIIENKVNGSNLLHLLITLNNVTLFKNIIDDIKKYSKLNEFVNELDSFGNTPLMHALQMANLEFVECLINNFSNELNLNHNNDFFSTPYLIMDKYLSIMSPITTYTKSNPVSTPEEYQNHWSQSSIIPDLLPSVSGRKKTELFSVKDDILVENHENPYSLCNSFFDKETNSIVEKKHYLYSTLIKSITSSKFTYDEKLAKLIISNCDHYLFTLLIGNKNVIGTSILALKPYINECKNGLFNETTTDSYKNYDKYHNLCEMEKSITDFRTPWW
jgi:hypothetical protein